MAPNFSRGLSSGCNVQHWANSADSTSKMVKVKYSNSKFTSVYNYHFWKFGKPTSQQKKTLPKVICSKSIEGQNSSMKSKDQISLSRICLVC